MQTHVLIKEECILKNKVNYVHIRSYLCFITFVLKLLGLTLYSVTSAAHTQVCVQTKANDNIVISKRRII